MDEGKAFETAMQRIKDRYHLSEAEFQKVRHAAIMIAQRRPNLPMNTAAQLFESINDRDELATMCRTAKKRRSGRLLDALTA